MDIGSILELQKSHWNAIKNHIDTAPGVEVCGLIGGVWQPFPRLAIAREVVPVPNIDPRPAQRFLMEPQAQLTAMLRFERLGWDVVGIYHSHPHGSAQPSAADTAEAFFPDAIYLIGLPGGDLTAWRIVAGVAAAAQLRITA